MTPIEFLLALMQLDAKYPFSEVGGKRTPSHNDDVDGVANSPHLYWVGRDVVFDKPPKRPELIEATRRLGLAFVPEQDHVHIQPAGWIPG